MDQPLVAIVGAGCALVVLAAGLVRVALQGFIGVAFGGLCAAALLSTALSLAATHLTAAGLAADAGSPSVVGSAIASSPVLRAVLLSLSLPSVTSMALLAALLIVAYYARIVACAGAEVEVLLAHVAATGHATGATLPENALSAPAVAKKTE